MLSSAYSPLSKHKHTHNTHTHTRQGLAQSLWTSIRLKQRIFANHAIDRLFIPTSSLLNHRRHIEDPYFWLEVISLWCLLMQWSKPVEISPIVRNQISYNFHDYISHPNIIQILINYFLNMPIASSFFFSLNIKLLQNQRTYIGAVKPASQKV